MAWYLGRHWDNFALASLISYKPAVPCYFRFTDWCDSREKDSRMEGRKEGRKEGKVTSKR